MDLKIGNDMNEQKKFKVGNRVRSKFYGIVGTVIDVDKDGYIINPDHLDEMWIAEDDAERYDPKAAFLSELKELLAKYDASIIGGGYEGYGDYLQVQLRMDEPFDVGESEYGDRCILTADNVMNYDKE